MTDVDRDIAASPEAVSGVLADGWLYGLWVVGASHIRAVDAGWPKPGTCIHHAVGAWPFLIKDTSESLEFVPGRLLVLRARGWPIGEATVRVEISPAPGGSHVVLRETFVRGPGTVIRPLEPLLIAPRNRESLHRLAALAEGR